MHQFHIFKYIDAIIDSLSAKELKVIYLTLTYLISLVETSERNIYISQENTKLLQQGLVKTKLDFIKQISRHLKKSEIFLQTYEFNQ